MHGAKAALQHSIPKAQGETSALQEISVDGTNSVNDKSAVYCGWPQSRDARSLSHADSCASAVAAVLPLCRALQRSMGLLILQASSAGELFLCR